MGSFTGRRGRASSCHHESVTAGSEAAAPATSLSSVAAASARRRVSVHHRHLPAKQTINQQRERTALLQSQTQTRCGARECKRAPTRAGEQSKQFAHVHVEAKPTQIASEKQGNAGRPGSPSGCRGTCSSSPDRRPPFLHEPNYERHRVRVKRHGLQTVKQRPATGHGRGLPHKRRTALTAHRWRPRRRAVQAAPACA